MKRPPSDPGLHEITAWVEWFLAAHEERLLTFPDRHLVEQERASIKRLADAIHERMVSDYLLSKQR